MGRDNGDPRNTLKPQPGQTDQYYPKFHPLPGEWAKSQLDSSSSRGGQGSSRTMHGSPTSRGGHGPMTEVQRAIAAEKAQHDYWNEWQGVTPGKPIYEDPRAFQNTLLPVAKYGTDGRGD